MSYNISRYDMIIFVGNMEDLLKQLEEDNISIKEIVNVKYDDNMTLLHRALTSRKFDIANYLLDNGAEVNVVTDYGLNELGGLSHNLTTSEAAAIGRRLLNMGVSLTQKDKKYGNTTIFTLVRDSFRRISPEAKQFIYDCFALVDEIDEPNKFGFTLRAIIERGTDETLKQMVKEKDDR